MIIDALLAIAVMAAIAGACTKNWTARALLASFVFSTILCRLGTEFNLVLWIGIDLMVIAFIARRGMPLIDKVVCALFVPAWALYLWQPSWGPQAVALVVAAQMLLTFPLRRANSFIGGAMAYLAEHRNDHLNFVSVRVLRWT